MTKIGIYSGTFDPVHKGHLGFAQAALKECRLDKVFFLVEPKPRRKQGVKAFEHRIQMVRLAIKPNDRFGSIILEQQRFTPAGTLPILRERFKGADLYMLIGEDFFAHLSSWPHVDHLIKSVRFIISVRKGTITETKKAVKTLEQTRGLRLNYQIITSDFPDVSSSKVRLELRHGRLPEEIPASVLEYIQVHNLYHTQRT